MSREARSSASLAIAVALVGYVAVGAGDQAVATAEMARAVQPDGARPP